MSVQSASKSDEWGLISHTLSAGDVSDLRWFFDSGGFIRFTQSTMGHMLDRAQLFTFGSDPCEACGGDREQKLPGTGFTSSGKKTRSEEQCSEMLALLDIELPRELGDVVCGKCRGMGVIARTKRSNGKRPITAYPTGSSKRGGGIDVDHGDVMRLGQVTRRLDRVRAAAPLAADILSAYYTERGGLFACYPLTPAGKKLLRTNPQKLPPLVLLRNVSNANRDNPKPSTTALLEGAQEQAKSMHQQACKVWNRIAKGQKPRGSVVLLRAMSLLDGAA